MTMSIMGKQDSEHMPGADRLKELLVGHKIVKAEGAAITDDLGYRDDNTGVLTLDDGTVIEVEGNDGGCACNSGCYPLTELNHVDNIITNVEVEENPGGDYDEPYEGYYRIFVIAEDRRLMVASFDGTDGNGYYGTGWWMRVREAEPNDD